MPKKNIELLKRLRTRFLRMRHPEHFDMKAVAAKTECGAAMCFIGHALDLEGYKMRLMPEAMRDGCFDYEFISPKGRRVRKPQITARRLLGFTDKEADDVFLDFEIETPEQAVKRIESLINNNATAN